MFIEEREAFKKELTSVWGGGLKSDQMLPLRGVVKLGIFHTKKVPKFVLGHLE